jgi:hypothetical protein
MNEARGDYEMRSSVGDAGIQELFPLVQRDYGWRHIRVCRMA